MNKKLLQDLRKREFLFNVDECLSNAKGKTFSILVTYYSDELKRVVVQHFKSASFTIVNANNLFDYVINLLRGDEIPIANLISNLPGSTNHMRGKIAGFELLLRMEATHLLDIDGDTCHHVHNASKKFLLPFNKHIEQLLTDLRTDMEWNTDLREYLKEICPLLSIPYSMPAVRVDHRWLSSYDAPVTDEPMLPALTRLYCSWLSKEGKIVYKDIVQELKEVCIQISYSTFNV